MRAAAKYEVKHAVARAREEGALVDSAFGRTRELLGVELRFDLADVRANVARDSAELRVLRERLPWFAAVLGRDPGSRRAAAWVGEVREGEEKTCLPFVQFLIRRRRLYAFVFARSVDLERKLSNDVAVLGVAARELAALLGGVVRELGTLRIYAASAHVYTD